MLPEGGSSMKKLIVTISLILLVTTPCFAKTYYIVIAGQSNANGIGLTSELTTGQNTIPSNVEVHVQLDDDPFTKLHAYTDLTYFGVEVMFARTVAAARKSDRFIIIKTARKNSSLYVWDPKWTCAKANYTNDCPKGDFYSILQKNITTALNGRAATFGGIVWIQGEKDGGFKIAADNYLTNLNTTMTALRTSRANSTAPVILAVTNPPYTGYSGLVSQAQIDSGTVLKNFYPITTQGLPKDKYHYTGPSLLKLGKTMGAKWIEVQSGS
jgi:hypothetical protein